MSPDIAVDESSPCGIKNLILSYCFQFLVFVLVLVSERGREKDVGCHRILLWTSSSPMGFHLHGFSRREKHMGESQLFSLLGKFIKICYGVQLLSQPKLAERKINRREVADVGCHRIL